MIATPSASELADDLEQTLGVLPGEAARGLVHDQDAGPVQNGPGDFDDLPGADAQPSDGDVERDLGMVEKGQRLADARRIVPAPEKARRTPSRPRTMFSSTVRCGARVSSW